MDRRNDVAGGGAVLPVLDAALILGILAGSVCAVVQVWTSRWMDVPGLKLYLSTVCIDGALLGALWAVGVAVLSFRFLRRMTSPSRWNARTAAAAGLLLPSLYIAYRVCPWSRAVRTRRFPFPSTRSAR